MSVCLSVCVILTGQLLSCLGTNLADILVDGWGRSCLLCPKVAPRSSTRGCCQSVKVLFLSCLWADLADTLLDGQDRYHRHLATRWRPNRASEAGYYGREL